MASSNSAAGGVRPVPLPRRLHLGRAGQLLRGRSEDPGLVTFQGLAECGEHAAGLPGGPGPLGSVADRDRVQGALPLADFLRRSDPYLRVLQIRAATAAATRAIRAAAPHGQRLLAGLVRIGPLLLPQRRQREVVIELPSAQPRPNFLAVAPPPHRISGDLTGPALPIPGPDGHPGLAQRGNEFGLGVGRCRGRADHAPQSFTFGFRETQAFRALDLGTGIAAVPAAGFPRPEHLEPVLVLQLVDHFLGPPPVPLRATRPVIERRDLRSVLTHQARRDVDMVLALALLATAAVPHRHPPGRGLLAVRTAGEAHLVHELGRELGPLLIAEELARIRRQHAMPVRGIAHLPRLALRRGLDDVLTPMVSRAPPTDADRDRLGPHLDLRAVQLAGQLDLGRDRQSRIP